MRHPSSMSPRLHLLIYGRRLNRDCSRQLLLRHCSSRHLLRSSPLPLCSFYGSCLCNRCRLRALVPSFLWLYPPHNMNQSPLRCNVRWGKPNLLPTTLPWPSWNASTLFRLPRRLYPLKHGIIYRLPSFSCGSNHVPVYHLRSLRS